MDTAPWSGFGGILYRTCSHLQTEYDTLACEKHDGFSPRFAALRQSDALTGEADDALRARISGTF